MPRFACSTASFPADDPAAAVRRVAWAGYEGLELAVADGALPEADVLRASLRAEGLILAAVHAGSLPIGGDVVALGRIGRSARLARELDGGLVVVEAPTAGSVAPLAAALTLLGKALDGLPVRVGVQNRAGTLLDTPAAFRSLHDCGVPPSVSAALDPGEALLAGWNPSEALTDLGLPVEHVYLTDARAGRRVPIGEGDLDLIALGSTLAAARYAGWISVRLEGADPWAAEPLAREVREAAADWLAAH